MSSKNQKADPDTVLEQWKFYAQTTLNVSNRRLKNNRFYIRLLLGLLAAIGAGTKLGFVNPVGIMFAGLIGFPMCVIWYFHILSYKQLNSGKYQVLKEIASDLPYAPHEKEWDVLGNGENPGTYIKHTSVEVWWPRVLGLPFTIMAIYGGLKTLALMKYYELAIILTLIVWAIYYISIMLGKPLFGTINNMFDSKIPYINENSNK
jgi:hypothetical protein